MLFRKKRTKARKVTVKRKAKTKAKKTRAKKRVKRAKKTRRVIRKVQKVSARKEVLIGKVTHYFPQVKAGALILKSGALTVGDTVHIKGHTTDFKQKIKSMQVDRNPIEKASKGYEIGILVKARVRVNDDVYKIML